MHNATLKPTNTPSPQSHEMFSPAHRRQQPSSLDPSKARHSPRATSDQRSRETCEQILPSLDTTTPHHHQLEFSSSGFRACCFPR